MAKTDLSGRLGFIGCGQLGSALIQGIIDSKLYPPRRLYVFDRNPAKTRMFPDVQHCTSAFETVYNVDTVFLAVKPQDIVGAMEGARLEGKVLVSMVAGVTCDELRANLNGCDVILRVMPNLAVRVREGATAYEIPNNLSPVQLERVLNIFRACGMVEALREDDMDVATALNGSGPAYFTYFIDAMARAAQSQGMSYDAAMRLILQTAKGAIALIADSGEPANRLIEAVCSPGGTTEAALKVFRRRSLRDAVEKAVDTATRRARDLADMLPNRPQDQRY